MRFRSFHRGFRRLVALLLLLHLTGLSATAAPQRDARDPRGEAFTDPKKHAVMHAGWAEQPVTYGEGVGKADVVVSLEQDVYQIILPLIREYAAKTGLNIVVQEGTCGIAAGMLARKSVDMGGFCCPAGDEDRFPGIRFHTLGIVGKAFLVHPDNPINNLTISELRNIYLGKTNNWSELRTPSGKPGPDRLIKAIGRLHCQTRPGHWRLLLDRKELFSQRMLEVGSIPDMITRVSSAPNAIGWEVLSMVDKYQDRGRVKVLTVGGYRPNDPDAIAALKYPFYRTYNITTWEGKGIANRNAQALAEYLITASEKLNPARYGFVSASRLRKAGWKFLGNELIGEPK
jgi:phosphate transport system substrate-binding protein